MIRFGALALFLAIPYSMGAQLRGPQLAFGGGLGSGSTSCTECFATSEGGRGGFVQLDVPLDRTSRIGVQWDRWRGREVADGGRSDFVLLMTEHRVPGGRFFFKLGAGYGSTHHYLRRLTAAPVLIERAGFAYQSGLGYDVLSFAHVAVAPYVQGTALLNGRGRVDGIHSEEVSFSMTALQYGIAMRAR